MRRRQLPAGRCCAIGGSFGVKRVARAAGGSNNKAKLQGPEGVPHVTTALTRRAVSSLLGLALVGAAAGSAYADKKYEIGRASCRERV